MHQSWWPGLHKCLKLLPLCQSSIDLTSLSKHPGSRCYLPSGWLSAVLPASLSIAETSKTVLQVHFMTYAFGGPEEYKGESVSGVAMS